MPVRESEAIVLRSFPLGEGDRLVSFLSRSFGRLRGVAGGARRPKSRFGATLESLTYIRIWFYERETRELVRISQTELIESFLDAQRDYLAGVALAVVSDISEAALGEREVAEPNFRLLLTVARAIKAGAAPSLALAYFALWTVRLGGWLPRLDHCARCGAALLSCGYAATDGTLFCRECRLPGQPPISQPVIDLARRVLKEKLEVLMAASLAPDPVVELREYMLNAIEHHIERRLHARALLTESREPLS
jgi:DNA repair protein RecO (recombination protein O)